eukprot:873912_1
MIESTNGYCNKEQKGHENHKEVKCMFVKVIQSRCRWPSCGETILSRHVVYVVYHPHTKLEGTKPVQWHCFTHHSIPKRSSLNITVHSIPQHPNQQSEHHLLNVMDMNQSYHDEEIIMAEPEQDYLIVPPWDKIMSNHHWDVNKLREYDLSASKLESICSSTYWNASHSHKLHIWHNKTMHRTAHKLQNQIYFGIHS